MSLYHVGVGATELMPTAPRKQGSVPAWVGPLGIATLAGIITVVFARATSRPTSHVMSRAESMWVKR